MSIKTFIYFIGILSFCSADKLVIVIVSQPNSHHEKLALENKRNILEQAKHHNLNEPVVHLSHLDFPHAGGWTITPLIPKLTNLHSTNSTFIIFIEDITRIRFNLLHELLANIANHHDEDVFVGFALRDTEASIIHHFAFFDDPQSFKYPNTASGFALSTSLLIKLKLRIQNQKLKTDFSIDHAHEFALFVWNDGNGVELTHEDKFCLEEKDDCVAYPEIIEKCDNPIDKKSIYFAVKTCEKFHKDRVPVLKKTWAKHAKFITYFSDAEDEKIPTKALTEGNSDKGHCEKTLGIISHIAKEIKNDKFKNIKWIFIADDDTILSVSGVQNLLSCYNSSEYIALGQRYGFDVQKPGGYNYITGGGGMVFSLPVLELLANPKNCKCPSASTPDDMFIGICLQELGIPITHSSYFHQARPADYASGYLKSQKAVSFHKHWMVDPIKVYQNWFADADADSTNNLRTEL